MRNCTLSYHAKFQNTGIKNEIFRNFLGKSLLGEKPLYLQHVSQSPDGVEEYTK